MMAQCPNKTELAYQHHNFSKADSDNEPKSFKLVETTAKYSRTKLDFLIKLIKNQCKNKRMFIKFYIA